MKKTKKTKKTPTPKKTRLPIGKRTDTFYCVEMADGRLLGHYLAQVPMLWPSAKEAKAVAREYEPQALGQLKIVTFQRTNTEPLSKLRPGIH